MPASTWVSQNPSLTVAATTTEARFTTTRLTAVEHGWEAEVGFCDSWPYAWGLLGSAVVLPLLHRDISDVRLRARSDCVLRSGEPAGRRAGVAGRGRPSRR